jgi:hypothetical protein
LILHYLQVNEKIQEMRKLKASIIADIKENTRVFSDNLNQIMTTARTQQVHTRALQKRQATNTVPVSLETILITVSRSAPIFLALSFDRSAV